VAVALVGSVAIRDADEAEVDVDVEAEEDADVEVEAETEDEAEAEEGDEMPGDTPDPVVPDPATPTPTPTPTPAPADVDPNLWVVKPLTAANSFTFGIEGPAVDVNGFVYAQNYKAQHTVGKIDPKTGAGSVLISLGNGVGSGMRIDAASQGFIADYKTHSIWKVDLTRKTKAVYAQSNLMTQPNDITLAADGTLWASDPNFGKNSGRVWRIRQSKVELAASGLGPSNGIDLSPDGSKLYVNEGFTGKDGKASNSMRIWEFTVTSDPNKNVPIANALTNKRLVGEYANGGCDGMRVDTDGNLYVTRNPGGVVNKINPATGEILKTITVIGQNPANICFGGDDGKTAFVTEEQFKRIITFRVDSVGLEWARLHKAHP